MARTSKAIFTPDLHRPTPAVGNSSASLEQVSQRLQRNDTITNDLYARKNWHR